MGVEAREQGPEGGRAGVGETIGVLFLRMETGVAGTGVITLGIGMGGGETGQVGKKELEELIDPIWAESDEILSEILASSKEKSWEGGTEEEDDMEAEIT